MEKKNDEKKIKVGENYPKRFTNSKFDLWFFFILETIINIFSKGYANYTLTERELNHKETPKDIIQSVGVAVVVVIIMYFVIKYRQ